MINEKIITTEDEVVIDFSKYDDFWKLIEDMEDRHLYLQEYDGVNIYNAKKDMYFRINEELIFSNFNHLIEDGDKVFFDRIKNEDMIESIKHEYRN